MKTILFGAALMCSLAVFSQTKLIFHKSHSGTATLFSSAAPGYSSNFGVAPTPLVREAELDSVIFLNDTAAVMVTSEYCSRSSSNKRLWKAGRDTVYHHELFSQQHALNTIRETLMQQYYFAGDIDSTVFIGYDNDWRQQQNEVTPIDKNREKRNELYLLLVFVSAVLVFGWGGSVFKRKVMIRED